MRELGIYFLQKIINVIKKTIFSINKNHSFERTGAMMLSYTTGAKYQQ